MIEIVNNKNYTTFHELEVYNFELVKFGKFEKTKLKWFWNRKIESVKTKASLIDACLYSLLVVLSCSPLVSDCVPLISEYGLTLFLSALGLGIYGDSNSDSEGNQSDDDKVQENDSDEELKVSKFIK